MHPEMLPGEVWLTNSDEEGFHEIGWNSKRRGKVAYDTHGIPILSPRWDDAFPIFAQTSELAQKGVIISD
jgi:hypothetical protein